MNRKLRAGAARVALDPPIGLAMAGYGRRVGRSAGVHDSLNVQAIVIGDGESKIAIAGVDLLALGTRICAAVAEEVAASSDIAREAVIVCATHTHSAPNFNIFATPGPAAKPSHGRDLEWERTIPRKIAAGILAADSSMEPAVIRTAGVEFGLGTNRRLRRADGTIQLAANYAGPVDHQAVGLGAYRINGSSIGFIINYGCHGVMLCEDNLCYSRDWPGFALDAIERAEGGVGIFIQGAAGNVDPRSRGNFEVASEWGVTLGEKMAAALRAAPGIESARVQTRKIDLSLNLRPLDREIESARQIAAQTSASLQTHRGGAGAQSKRLNDHHNLSLMQLAALEAIEEQNRRDRRVDIAQRTISCAVALAAIGDLAIAGIPGELFAELGMALKASSPFDRTITAGYCNDLIGYIPTRAAYDEGGYEVESARVARESGEQVLEAALGGLRAMFSDR